MSTMAKRWLPLLILAAGVAGFLLLRLTRPEPPDAEPAERSWRVGVQTLTLARHTPVLPLYGEVVAPDQLTVTWSSDKDGETRADGFFASASIRYIF